MVCPEQGSASIAKFDERGYTNQGSGIHLVLDGHATPWSWFRRPPQPRPTASQGAAKVLQVEHSEPFVLKWHAHFSPRQ
jgi:hypothetical protein